MHDNRRISSSLNARPATDLEAMRKLDLRVDVMGEMRLTDGDEALPPPRGAPAQKLLAWLVMGGARVRPRADIADLLFPSGGARAASLNNAVAEIKRALGDVRYDALVAGSGTRTLGPRPRVHVAVDADDLRSGDPEVLADARACHDRRFLEHLNDDEDTWVRATRQALDRQIDETLERLTGDADAEGRFAEAVAWATQRATREPLDEAACRTLILTLHRAGEDARARDELDVFVARRQQLVQGWSPGADLARLAERVGGRPAAAQSAQEPVSVTAFSPPPSAAAVVVGSEPARGERSPRSRVAVAALGLAFVLPVVAAVLIVGLQRHNHPAASRSHRVASPIDDSNPQTTDACAQSAVIVPGSRTPIVRNGARVGVLELRYSTACNTAWARAFGVPVVPRPDFHIVTVRGSDGRTTQDTFGVARHVNQGVAFNNQLLASGCIEAEAWFGRRRQAFTHTRCLAYRPASE
jgi:DNA-binding SARP family transcriptional activator